MADLEYRYRWDPEFRTERFGKKYTGYRPNETLPDPLRQAQAVCRTFFDEPSQWQARYTYLSNPFLPPNNRDRFDPNMVLSFVFENDDRLDSAHLMGVGQTVVGPFVMPELRTELRSLVAARRSFGGYALPEEAKTLIDNRLGSTPYRTGEVSAQYDNLKLAPMDYCWKTGVIIFDIALLEATQQRTRLDEEIAAKENEIDALKNEREKWVHAAAQNARLV